MTWRKYYSQEFTSIYLSYDYIYLCNFTKGTNIQIRRFFGVELFNIWLTDYIFELYFQLDLIILHKMLVLLNRRVNVPPYHSTLL